jgi:hypothetical protein
MSTQIARNVKVSLVLSIVVSVALLFASACAPLGACEGYSDILGSSYCYDDWTEDECDDYDAEEVNGADWSFHPGDTCADLGIY